MRSQLVDAWHTVAPPRDDPHGPLPPLLVTLTVVTGLVDAFSYLTLGHVFVANMTGNVVFLGFALAGAQGFSVTASLAALGSFAIGSLLGGRLIVVVPRDRGRLLAAAAAAQVLLVAAAMIVRLVAGSDVSRVHHYLIILLLAITMGLQNATVRKLAVPDLTTTVLTLTATGIFADSHVVGGPGSKAGRRTVSILAMFLGALVGAVLVLHAPRALPLVVALVLLVAVAFATGLVSPAPVDLGDTMRQHGGEPYVLEPEPSPVVDVHIHYLPQRLAETLLARTQPPRAAREGRLLVLDFGDGYIERVDASAADPDHLRETLETAGIDIAMVSVNQPGVLYLPPEEAAAVARDANDELMALAGASGGRLEGLATLPWQLPDLAVSELERAVSIGARGAMACSNVAGHSLDEAHFDQVFGASEALGAPLLLHPSLPLGVQTLGLYGITCAAGFLMDTTTAILRIILGGTLDRHPGLRMILAHAGSLLPQLAGRLDLEYAHGTITRSLAEGRRPTDYIRMLYTDTVAGYAQALRAAVELFGVDRIMLGSDYPFWDHDVALRLVREADFDDDVTARITGRNAMELFGLRYSD